MEERRSKDRFQAKKRQERAKIVLEREERNEREIWRESAGLNFFWLGF